MRDGISETEQLQTLLFHVYKQVNEGAGLQEVMNTLKEELPKITKVEEAPVR